VLPDHLHCIWTLPASDADFATRWRLIKLLFAKGLPKDERRSELRRKRGERGIWHRRYWEHTIRDDWDFRSHVDYIHINPVKHGCDGRNGGEMGSNTIFCYADVHFIANAIRIIARLTRHVIPGQPRPG